MKKKKKKDKWTDINEIGICKAAKLIGMHPRTMREGILNGKLTIPHREVPFISSTSKIYKPRTNKFIFKAEDVLEWLESTRRN